MPDIEPPLKLSAIDVVSLAPIEAYAVLIHLAGHRDPAVQEAVIDAVRGVLERTRGCEASRALLIDTK